MNLINTGKETILGEEFEYRIYTGAKPPELKHIIASQEEIQTLIERHSKLRMSGLVEELKSLLVYMTMPNFIQQCGIPLELGDLEILDQKILWINAYGFSNLIGSNMDAAAKASLLVDARPLSITLYQTDESDSEEKEPDGKQEPTKEKTKTPRSHIIYARESWDVHMPLPVANLLEALENSNRLANHINLVRVNNFLSHEAMILVRCHIDKTLRVAAHWGEAPLSLHLPSLPKT